MGLGALCFTTGAPGTLGPLIDIYKTAVQDAEPVGEYVNDNVMVTKPPGFPVWPDLVPEPTFEGLERQIADGLVCIGTPEEVTRAVRGFADVGADQLTFGMLSTTMPVDVAIEAVETFGRHVLPEFDKDRVHNTTRQREAFLAAQRPRHYPSEGELPPFRV